MAIRAGSGGGGGGFGRRGRRRIERGQPQKPIVPVGNPFPEKKEFRLGGYTIIEEKDDYLVCRGFDPNAKDPFSQITPAANRTIKVAKPSLLLRTVWENATSVTIGGIAYTYEYSDAEFGVRTARWTDDEGVEQEEEQRIDTPYFPDDVIVAVELRKSVAVDGIDVASEDGGRLSWVDLNISGRHWKGEGGEEDSGFWARITDRDGDEYTWVEVESGGEGDFSTVAGGRSGSAGGTNPAFDVNQHEYEGEGAFSFPAIVWMRRGLLRGEDDFEWLFEREQDGFFARITDRHVDVGGDASYSWVEVIPTKGGPVDKANGRSGTANGVGEAFEVNQSRANFHVPTNMVVRMWKAPQTGSADPQYQFDRGLTDESDGARHPVDGAADEWDVNDQPAGKAGWKVPDLLTLNGDVVRVEQDSHGQTVAVLRTEDGEGAGGSNQCGGDTPFNGNKDRVTEVELTINSATLSGDCTTISIDFDLTVTKETDCYHNGLLMA